MKPGFPKLTIILLCAALATACNSLKPRKQDGAPGTSQLAVAFDAEAMGDMADSMKTLLFRIYDIENDTRGAQEGSDQSKAIVSGQTEYVLDGIGLGMKEIYVAILDTNDEALGEGVIRHKVIPGRNVTDELVIKIKRVSQATTSITLNFDFTGTTSAIEKATVDYKIGEASETVELEKVETGDEIVTIESIRPLMEDNCISCHNDRRARGGLDLEGDFSSDNLTTEDMNEEIVARMLDEDDPMPPGGLLEDEDLTIMKDWKSAGFLKSAPSGLRYSLVLDEQKVSDSLSFSLKLLGDDDVELFKKDYDNHTITEGLVVNITENLSIEGGQVAVPIRVEPED